jgi:hypothetical protein
MYRNREVRQGGKCQGICEWAPQFLFGSSCYDVTADVD